MTDTLTGDARRNVALFSTPGLGFKPKFRFEKRAKDGKPEAQVLVVEDMAVFRSGHFYDSMGFEHTWEEIHIDQMVANFSLLRNRGIFADVPVRNGHPGFLENRLQGLIGYHTSDLRSESRKNPVDGVDYLYLIATFEVLDPTAIEKIASGLWRHVSSEVGGWVSNNSTEFWPVYQGVAYVDIPAVEGLSSFNTHNGVGASFSVLSENKEAPVAGEATPGNQGQAAAGSGSTGSNQPSANSPAASFQTTDPAAFARSQFAFTIGGRQTQDFSSVQTHITTLETAMSEQREQHRKDFIKGLAEGAAPKIMATQIPQIEGYALGMTDDSWKLFQESWGTAQSVSAVSSHAVGVTNSNGTAPVTGAAGPTETDTAAAVVAQHRKSGMKPEELAKTGSFQKLQKLDPNHPALSA